MIQIISRTGAFHKRALQGFEQEMARRGCLAYEVTTIGADNGFEVTCNQIRVLLEKGPTALVTFGDACTQAAAAVTAQVELPHFFCGATQTHFLENLHASNNGRVVAGVNMGQPLHIAAAHVARFLKPHMKQILMPYSTLGDQAELVNNVALIGRYFKQHGIEMKVAQLYNRHDSMAAIEAALEGVDAILCLENSAQYLDVPAVIKLCNTKQITFFSGDREAVLAGAAAGFVADAALAGKELARLVYAVMYKNMSLSEKPVDFLGCNARALMLNKRACALQGIAIDEPLLYLLNMSVVHGFISLDDYGIIAGYPAPTAEEIDL